MRETPSSSVESAQARQIADTSAADDFSDYAKNHVVACEVDFDHHVLRRHLFNIHAADLRTSRHAVTDTFRTGFHGEPDVATQAVRGTMRTLVHPRAA